MKYFPQSLKYSRDYMMDVVNITRALIGRCPWSVRVQTAWRTSQETSINQSVNQRLRLTSNKKKQIFLNLRKTSVTHQWHIMTHGNMESILNVWKFIYRRGILLPWTVRMVSMPLQCHRYPKLSVNVSYVQSISSQWRIQIFKKVRGSASKIIIISIYTLTSDLGV